MRDDQYVLNHCTTYLARTNSDARHDFGFGHFEAGDLRGRIREAWRFPIIDSCEEPPDDSSRSEFNDVTFVYPAFDAASHSVAVVGKFASVHTPIDLRRIRFLDEETAYLGATVTVRRRGVFLYKFFVDGQPQIDPTNPQRARADNGVEWSRFFTWEFSQPLLFERWELGLLQRLCNHILPFRTRAGQRFLSQYYDNLDRDARRGLQRRAYRLDDSAGAAIFIDHLLAKEESHHLGDYRKCLKQIDRILRQRDPYHEPIDVSKDLYNELYEELAADSVNGWDRDDYGSPRYFLELLRRHAFTGAFSHPKYGGNAATAGWAYLDKELALFDWQRSLEQPLGRSAAYLG